MIRSCFHNYSTKKLFQKSEYSSVRHISSTHESHLFSTQNPSVQHQNVEVNTRYVELRVFWCWTEGCAELKGFWCGIHDFLCWTDECVELRLFLLNLRILGAEKEWPFLLNWCVELRMVWNWGGPVKSYWLKFSEHVHKIRCGALIKMRIAWVYSKIPNLF